VSFAARHAADLAAPPEVVWPLLVDFPSWPRWWADCRLASRRDRRPLAEGSRVELIVRLGRRERSLDAVVDLLNEGRGLTLVARGWFLRLTVSWELRALAGASTRLRLHAAFAGIASGRLGAGRELLEASLRRHLRGLSQAAERLA